MELNPDAILEELNEFEKRNQEVTPMLNEYLLKIAKTGNILLPWSKLKPLLKRKMELAITEFCKSCPPDTIPSYPNTDKFEYERLKASILEVLDFFTNAPFTIQRLCELITNPKKHYNRTDKYMRGLEKNLLVVSTIGHNENDDSADRDHSASNDWVNSDSSSEGHNFNDAATNASVATPAVNGTVLENFATVFPSATRIPNKPNNIQVAIVTDNSAYQSAGVQDLEYEVIDSSDLSAKPDSHQHEIVNPELQEQHVYYSGTSTDVVKLVVPSEESDDTSKKDLPLQDVEAGVCVPEDSSTGEESATGDSRALPGMHTLAAKSADDIDVIDDTLCSSSSETVEESEPSSEQIGPLIDDKDNSGGSAKETTIEVNVEDVAGVEGTIEPSSKRRKYEVDDKPDSYSLVETSSEKMDLGGDPSSTYQQDRSDPDPQLTATVSEAVESEPVPDTPTSTTD